jgi:hypothetical protein
MIIKLILIDQISARRKKLVAGRLFIGFRKTGT